MLHHKKGAIQIYLKKKRILYDLGTEKLIVDSFEKGNFKTKK